MGVVAEQLALVQMLVTLVIPVTGFANDTGGRSAMRAHAVGLSAAALPDELARRLWAGGIM